MKTAGSLVTLALLMLPVAGCDQGPSKQVQPATVVAASPSPSPSSVATAATAATGGAAVTGTKYGAGVTLPHSESIDAILAAPKTFVGKTVRVEGMITDVCEMRGCWMELAGEKPGQKLKFKVTDGVMTFPVDAKGKHAVAQGVVAVRDMTLDETKEYAEYTAKEQGKPFDPASVTAAMSVVRLDGTGAVLQ